MDDNYINDLAPIVLFVYNRPDHTKKTLDALVQNDLAKYSDLYIYLDGAKSGINEKGKRKIQEVKDIINTEKRFKSITSICSPYNKGLAGSVISGVTEVLLKYDKIIVLEDDLITSKYFLKFMNDALNTYRFETEVACISGYIYPVAQKLPETFFIKGADCWGWGTWKRAWDLFEPDGKLLMNRLKENHQLFDFDFFDSYPYSKMLEDQIAGKNNSWAIRWYASAYLHHKLTLYPGKSFIINIGIDGSGTHSGKKNYWQITDLNEDASFKKIIAVEDRNAKRIIATFFYKLHKRSLLSSIVLKAGKMLKRLSL